MVPIRHSCEFEVAPPYHLKNTLFEILMQEAKYNCAILCAFHDYWT